MVVVIGLDAGQYSHSLDQMLRRNEGSERLFSPAELNVRVALWAVCCMSRVGGECYVVAAGGWCTVSCYMYTIRGA